jgi:hypothetical protein
MAPHQRNLQDVTCRFFVIQMKVSIETEKTAAGFGIHDEK